jgi:hypothetical protein
MPVTFSFGGSGYHFPFMLGVAYGLRTRFELPWDQVSAHCISAGCAGALCLLLCTPREIEQVTLKGILLSHRLESKNYQSNLLKNLLPYRAAAQVGGRIVIGTTETPLLRPRLHTHGYQTQKHLIDKIEASCRIPLITGSWHRELDGGFSHRYAVSDENTVVITLKQYPRSDVYARRGNYFLELLLPPVSEMWDLFELGFQAVNNNYDVIARKIAAGLADTEGGVNFQPRR